MNSSIPHSANSRKASKKSVKQAIATGEEKPVFNYLWQDQKALKVVPVY